MTYEQAYLAIIDSIMNNSELALRKSIIDKRHFGNFTISYIAGDKTITIICDRGEIVFCADLVGEDCRTVFQSVDDISPEDLLIGLGLQ